jgi:hypothetical protein
LGNVNTGIPEPDDVGRPVPGHVRKLARIGVVAAPTSGGRTEGSKLVCRGGKVPVLRGERDIDARIPEPDDVGLPVPVHVRQFALVEVVAAPTSGGRTEGSKLVCGGGKVPVPRGERDIDARIPEPDDVGFAVPVYVCKLARKGVVADPTPGGRTEGSKLVCRGGKVPVPRGERDIDARIPEPDDVGRPVPVSRPQAPTMEKAFATTNPLLEQLATQSAAKTAEITKQVATFAPLGSAAADQVRLARLGIEALTRTKTG